MKKIVYLLAVLFVVTSCKNDVKINDDKALAITEEYASFGDKINADGALSTDAMALEYDNLKAGDTLVTKMRGTINEVCSKKGCWMKLDLGDEKEVMVRFKDYGFFMPLNATGEVVINGKAFVTETSIEELRHYAEDAGKTAEEIAAIAAPERTFAFEADGVLLKK